MTGTRITNEALAARAHHLNRRFILAGVDRHVFWQGRDGGMSLEEFSPKADPFTRRPLTFGTKREIATFMDGMLVAMDLVA